MSPSSLSFSFSISIPRRAQLGAQRASNWPINPQRERALANQEVTSPGSEVSKDNRWAEISYLRGQERVVCVCVCVCVCVYILSGVSIYSHGDLGQNGHSKHHNVLPDGRRCLFWLSCTDPASFCQINYWSCWFDSQWSWTSEGLRFELYVVWSGI